MRPLRATPLPPPSSLTFRYQGRRNHGGYGGYSPKVVIKEISPPHFRTRWIREVPICMITR